MWAMLWTENRRDSNPQHVSSVFTFQWKSLLLKFRETQMFFYIIRSGFVHVYVTCRVYEPWPEQTDLLYKSHSVRCLQDKTQQQVEDFYNSHCGGRAAERRRAPKDIEACLNMHTYVLQPKESVYFLQHCRRKGAVQRWFKEQSEQKRTQRGRMSKNTKKGNSFFTLCLFPPVCFKQVLVRVIVYLSTELQELEKGICKAKCFTQRK